MRKTVKSLLIAILFVVAGVMIQKSLVSMKKDIPKTDDKIKPTSVTINVVNTIDEGIPIISYGNIEPRVILQITAEVSGKVVFIHPELLDGNLISAGAKIFSIEKKDYEIAEKKALASLAENKASLEIIRQEEKNTLRTIAINKKNLELVQKELTRYKSLIQERSVSFSDVDKKENEFQTTLAALTQNENVLNLIPSRIAQAEAKVSTAEASYEQAQLDLQRAEILAPFTGRVLKKLVEVGEYVTKGKVLAELYNISTLEVKVPLAMNDLKWIIPEFHFAFVNTALNVENGVSANGTNEITVSIPSTLEKIRWSGKLVRLGPHVDPSTRTISAVVEIKEHGNEAEAKVYKPPLLKGMFVKVEFQGILLKNIFKIPRNLVSNENTVNIFTEPERAEGEGVLSIRPIQILHIHKDFVYVDKGLQQGEKLISTLLPYVVNGMKVVVSEFSLKNTSDKIERK